MCSSIFVFCMLFCDSCLCCTNHGIFLSGMDRGRGKELSRKCYRKRELLHVQCSTCVREGHYKGGCQERSTGGQNCVYGLGNIGRCIGLHI